MEIFILESIDQNYHRWLHPLGEQIEVNNEIDKSMKVKINKIRSSIQSDLINSFVSSGIRFSLKEVFDLELTIIKKFYQMIDINNEHKDEKAMTAFICITFSLFVLEEEKKYLMKNTFFTNMTVTNSFEESIKLFNFNNGSFDEKIINLAKFSENQMFRPSKHNRYEFSRIYEDIFLHFLSTIGDIILTKIPVSYITNGVMVNSTILSALIKVSEGYKQNIKPFYQKISEFIEFIRETDYIFSFCVTNSADLLNISKTSKKFNITLFVNSIKTDIDVLKSLVLEEKNNSIKDIMDFSDKLNTISLFTSTGLNREPLTKFFLSIEDKEIFNNVFKYRIGKYIDGDDITFSIKIVYEFFLNVKNVISANSENIEWLMQKNIMLLDDILLKLRLIKVMKKNNDEVSFRVFNEYMLAFDCIENEDDMFYMFNNDRINGRESAYKNDTSDADLYTRIAKTILFKKFLRVTCSSILCMGAEKTVLHPGIRHELINQNIKVYDKLSIEVHDGNRDKDTRFAMRCFLGLDDNGEFILEPEEGEEGEEGEDEEKKTQKEENLGRLTMVKIDQYVKEFFEYARVNLSYEESKNFFRVMGYDFNFDEYPKRKDDFSGFLCDKHYLDVCCMNGRVILAYLWEYAVINSLKEEILFVTKSFIQSDSYKTNGKLIEKDYVVCNEGKLQRFVVALLQGRYKLPDGKFVQIDDEEEMQKLVDRVTPLKRNDENVRITPAEAFDKVRDFIQGILLLPPADANGFFKELFQYIFMNNLEDHTFEIIECLSLYSETKQGFILNPSLAIANIFERMFLTSDYMIITDQIKEIGNGNYFNQDVIGNFFNDIGIDIDLIEEFDDNDDMEENEYRDLLIQIANRGDIQNNHIEPTREAIEDIYKDELYEKDEDVDENIDFNYEDFYNDDPFSVLDNNGTINKNCQDRLSEHLKLLGLSGPQNEKNSFTIFNPFDGKVAVYTDDVDI